LIRKPQKRSSWNIPLAQTIDTSLPQISYQLKIFKQPGVDVLPYALSLNFPNNLKVVSADKDIQSNGKNATLATQVEEDREVSIKPSLQIISILPWLLYNKVT